MICITNTKWLGWFMKNIFVKCILSMLVEEVSTLQSLVNSTFERVSVPCFDLPRSKCHHPTVHSTTISRFLCNFFHRMAPHFCDHHDSPHNLGHSWVIFEGWSQILHLTKLFRQVFEQSRSAMATQKLEKKVQQHDEVVESSKTGCRSQSRAQHTSRCLHWSATPMPAASCAQHHLGGLVCSLWAK